MDDYNDLKQKELDSPFSGFSFAKEAQNAIRSGHWRKKYGLWTLLSAACDEAAEKCNRSINSFSDRLIDVDTCGVHSLKSIADSVDLGFLCKGLKEDYPLDVMELMDLLSVPKHILLDTGRVLSDSANDKLNRTGSR